MNLENKIFVQINDDSYKSSDGYQLVREYGKTSNGNTLWGHWVLRSPDKEFIDYDYYRNDISEKHNFKLE